jgi:hypothetical protein
MYTTTTEHKMTITITNIQDPTKYARFTWSDDLENCQHLAINIEDEEFDMMITSKAYEGANLEGWIVEID